MEIIKITEKIKETPNITTLRFEEEIHANPGQFVMVWIPDISEKPFSISYMPELGFTVMDIGHFSHALCSLSVGDKLGVRGPYGRGFSVSGNIKNILAVGGGVGIAPLLPVIEQNKDKNFTVIAGAKCRSEVLFEKRLNENKNSNVIVTTDDGSAGICGYATAPLANLLGRENFDLIIACGPEPMLSRIHELGGKFNVPVQLSLDRYMKCGLGICGSCAINGLMVCKDGPVFRGHELFNTDFGKFKRSKSGIKTSGCK
jgi:dihydroorotate dehydrogenase electron transfer subunit